MMLVAAEESPAESQRGTPSQPMSEPEAAMGGLWLASLTAVPESKQKRETSPAAELMRLEGRAAERITFGVDSGAALTVIGKDVTTQYPRVQGHTRRMIDCQQDVEVASDLEQQARERPARVLRR